MKTPSINTYLLKNINIITDNLIPKNHKIDIKKTIRKTKDGKELIVFGPYNWVRTLSKPENGANVQINVNTSSKELKDGSDWWEVQELRFRFTMASIESGNIITCRVPVDVLHDMKENNIPLIACDRGVVYRVPLDNPEYRFIQSNKNIEAVFRITVNHLKESGRQVYINHFKNKPKVRFELKKSLKKIIMIKKDGKDWCPASIKKAAELLGITYNEMYGVYRTALQNRCYERYGNYKITANLDWKDNIPTGNEFDPRYDGRYDGRYDNKDYKRFAKVMIWLKRNPNRIDFPNRWSDEEKAFAENQVLLGVN